MDDGFDIKFTSDEEVERSLDELMKLCSKSLEKDDSRLAIINPVKLQQIQFAYAVLKYITEGKDVQVSYKLHEPFKTMGSVTVEGKILAFDTPEWFSRIAEFASSTEVYPLAKNKVRMTFTFHGLTTLVE